MTKITGEALERASRVRLLIADVDGVMTDGRLYYGDEGEVFKAFDVKDGLGIRLAQRAGIEVGVITGRRSRIVAERAGELDLQEVHQRIHDKAACLNEILDRRGIDAQSVGFIGDDLIDLPAMRIAGFSAAPPDAVPEVVTDVDYVTRRSGGRGCLREVIDLILQTSGKWDSVVAPFLERSGRPGRPVGAGRGNGVERRN